MMKQININDTAVDSTITTVCLYNRRDFFEYGMERLE